jgi:hypothetical protein
LLKIGSKLWKEPGDFRRFEKIIGEQHIFLLNNNFPADFSAWFRLSAKNK